MSRTPKDVCRAEGMIKNFNTIEEFKNADRAGMLTRAAKIVAAPYTLILLLGC